MQDFSTGQYLELLLKDVNPVEFFRTNRFLITDGKLPVKTKGVLDVFKCLSLRRARRQKSRKKKAAAKEEHEEQIKEAREQLQDFIVKEKELGKNFSVET